MHYSFDCNKQNIFSNFNLLPRKSAYANNVAFLQNSQDVFEVQPDNNFSSKSRTKRNVLLVFAGVLATASIAFLFNKRMTLEKAQKIFQKTFLNDDISLDDTSKIISEFKEISKIEDKSNYILALFESAMKHYGLNHVETNLSIEDLPKHALGSMNGANTLRISKNITRDKVVKVIFHELRHAKQNDLMAQKNLNSYVTGILNRKTSENAIKESHIYKVIYSKNSTLKQKYTEKEYEAFVINAVKMTLLSTRKEHFAQKGLGKAELPKYDNLDAYLVKCFDAHKNYTEEDILGYYFNFLEQDARAAAKGICDVFKNLGKL